MLVGAEGDVAVMVTIAVPPSFKAEFKFTVHVVAVPETNGHDEPVLELFFMDETPEPAVAVIPVKPFGSNSLNLT